jgi:hypothetical protein
MGIIFQARGEVNHASGSQQNHRPEAKPKHTQTESVCLFLMKSKDVLSLAKEVTGLLREIMADIFVITICGFLLCLLPFWFVMTNGKSLDLIFNLLSVLLRLLRFLGV